MVSRVNRSENALGMLKLAEIYLDLGDVEKAESQFGIASKMVSDNNLAAVTQKFMVEARIDAERGRMDDAARHMSKAYYATNDIGRKNLKAISDMLGLKIRNLTESDFS